MWEFFKIRNIIFYKIKMILNLFICMNEEDIKCFVFV